MALLFERTQKCCRKQLDTADIVREAIFQQLWPRRFLQSHGPPAIRYAASSIFGSPCLGCDFEYNAGATGSAIESSAVDIIRLIQK
jgi:hypothetical protein